MAKLRGSKEGFLNHIKLWLEEGLSKPELLTEYTKAAIKNIEDEIKKRDRKKNKLHIKHDNTQKRGAIKTP
jgi:hypothetical protein